MKKVLLLLPLIFAIVSSCKQDEPYEEVEVPLSDILEEDISAEVNPSGIAPLTALVNVKAKDPVVLQLEVLGASPVKYSMDDYKTTHEIPVAGLYPGTNQLELKLQKENGHYAFANFELGSDTLPSFLPEVQINKAIKSSMEPGFNLCCLSLGNGKDFEAHPIMFDAEGVIRSYMYIASRIPSWISPVEPLENGNILFSTQNIIYEYNLMGDEVNRWVLPENYSFHHDIIQKPDGNFIAAVNDRNLETVDDQIIEIDTSTVNIVNTWDMREIQDMDRYDLNEQELDWFHMNAIWYSEKDNSLLVSGRNQSVLKVDYDNNLKWILAPHKGWGKAGIDGNGLETSDYLLMAVNSEGEPYPDSVQMGYTEPEDFNWSWGQHAPMYLDNGNLFLFDNGFNRNFNGDIQYSCGVEYKIDEENMTVERVWQYGKERGPEFFSMIISDVDVLPETSNRYLTSGITFSGDGYSTISEVTYPGKELVFDANLFYKNYFNPDGGFSWGGFDLTYRAERMKIGD